ncbi:hypothetical protein HY480_01490, partial [Candidatus Uhrbacteria bacterium]|nr:hypothetical protein [Candidatus Uhrbacteria bacterium]
MQVDAATLVIRGRDDRERVIRLSDDTRVRRFRDTITANDLAMHDRVVIIGSPTADGHIDAQFIRVLPQSPTRTRGR